MEIKYEQEFVKSIVEKFININNISHIGNGKHGDAFLINENIVVKFPKH